MKSRSIKTLRFITGILAVILIAFLVNGLYQDNISFNNPIDIALLIFLLAFILAFVLSWKTVKWSGILLMIWTAGVWIMDLLVIGDGSDSDSGQVSLVLSPVLVLGTLFLLEWYRTSKDSIPSEPSQWKFVLRVLLINYSVLYLILVIAELLGTTGKHQIDFPLLLLIFGLGFVVSWKKEFIAGIIFLIWCGLLAYEFLGFPGRPYSGPWLLCGIPILLQAIFYIKNHFEFRSRV